MPYKLGCPDKIDFNFHVKPILSDRCFACHINDKWIFATSMLDTPQEGEIRYWSDQGALLITDCDILRWEGCDKAAGARLEIAYARYKAGKLFYRKWQQLKSINCIMAMN